MNEQRFICGMGFPINSDDPIRIIHDKVEDKDYYLFADLCKIMNEQQTTIESLKMELELRTGAKLFSRRVLERKVKEQQATIRKLRNENIILKNKIEDLRGSLIIQNELLQRQIQKSDLDE